jgi:large subunit ribosomal protein L24
METEWSKDWNKSVQRRKQRKYRANAPLHVKQKFVHALLSKELRKELNKRSFGLRKGDEVKVMRGNMRGKTGKIEKVDLKNSIVTIEGLKNKKSTGEEYFVKFQPSNLMITGLNRDDKKRIKKSD